MNFQTMLETRQKEVNSILCVGLDVRERANYEDFVRRVIDATHPYVCAFKPNLAFYEDSGHQGMKVLLDIVNYIRAIDSRIPIIGDGKRADIGATNEAYADALFSHFGFDAVTVNPYFGGKSLDPFLKWGDKGIFVLCRTSNPGAGELQDLHTLTKNPDEKPEGMCAEEWLEILKLDAMPLYRRVAWNVKNEWNKNGNCGLVVGGTYPEELRNIRAIVGDGMPILSPGAGKQGGDIKEMVEAGINRNGFGLIINSSSAIIFDNNPDLAAKKVCDEINQYR